MSDRQHFGFFNRNRVSYEVWVVFDSDHIIKPVVERVYIIGNKRELCVRPFEYDKTNKLHVEAFIVVSTALCESSVVVDNLDQEDWPSDPRLVDTKRYENVTWH